MCCRNFSFETDTVVQRAKVCRVAVEIAEYVLKELSYGGGI